MSVLDHDHFQIPYPLPTGQMAIVVVDKCVMMQHDKLPDIEVDADGNVIPGAEFDRFVTVYLLPAMMALGSVEKPAKV